jgi:hypothetical protein
MVSAGLESGAVFLRYTVFYPVVPVTVPNHPSVCHQPFGSQKKLTANQLFFFL